MHPTAAFLWTSNANGIIARGFSDGTARHYPLLRTLSTKQVSDIVGRDEELLRPKGGRLRPDDQMPISEDSSNRLEAIRRVRDMLYGGVPWHKGGRSQSKTSSCRVLRRWPAHVLRHCLQPRFVGQRVDGTCASSHWCNTVVLARKQTLEEFEWLADSLLESLPSTGTHSIVAHCQADAFLRQSRRSVLRDETGCDYQGLTTDALCTNAVVGRQANESHTASKNCHFFDRLTTHPSSIQEGSILGNTPTSHQQCCTPIQATHRPWAIWAAWEHGVSRMWGSFATSPTSSLWYCDRSTLGPSNRGLRLRQPHQQDRLVGLPPNLCIWAQPAVWTAIYLSKRSSSITANMELVPGHASTTGGSRPPIVLTHREITMEPFSGQAFTHSELALPEVRFDAAQLHTQAMGMVFNWTLSQELLFSAA